MHTVQRCLASVSTILLLCSGAAAQNWSQRNPPTAPSARANHAMVYDSARQEVVLFGGQGVGGALGDTWVWNGATWTQRFPATSPPSRSNHAMAYDSVRQRVVLFGGAGGGGTWEWDGTNWTAMTFAGFGPWNREGHAMAFDAARQRVVMFGGVGYGDTWEWDGANWILGATVLPGGRDGHAMAYDPARQRTVMFGGFSLFAYGTFGMNDTWEWNGSWAHAHPNPPPGLMDHAMAWSPALQRVVMFGGSFRDTSGFIEYSDTWAFDGAQWAQLGTAVFPQSRSRHALAYDDVHGQLVLFGGSMGYPTPVLLGDTWVLGSKSAVATPYGAGCGIPPLALAPVAAARPILGQTARALVPNAPTPASALAIGFSNTVFGPVALPLPLDGFGLTGCFLHQSDDVVGLPLNPVAAGLEFALPLPTTPGLLGVHVFLQAYGFAPGQNPAQLTTSNGLEWKFGDV
jgi:hypothetical protein